MAPDTSPCTFLVDGVSPGMDVRAECSRCLHGNEMCLLRKKKKTVPVVQVTGL